MATTTASTSGVVHRGVSLCTAEELAQLAKLIPEGEDRSITDVFGERLTDP